MPKLFKSADERRDKSIRVNLNTREVMYLDKLIEVEGDKDKSNLIRRIIFDRYKKKVISN